MMQDPLQSNAAAMKAFPQACKNFEQMASAFQTLTKNMTQTMKGMHGNGQK